MSRKILFTSLKGGTGVTTVCFGLGLALAAAGERVLMVDGDRLSGGGMIIAGLGNMQVYTLADYERAACRAKQAIIQHPKSPNLNVMPALGLTDVSAARRAVSEVEGLFDYVLLDILPAAECDAAVIVTEPYLPSVKSADCCRSALADSGVKDIRLIVNKLSGAQVACGDVAAAEDTAKILRLPLLAVIPEDVSLSAGRWRQSTLNAFNLAAQSVTGKNGVVYDVLKGYSGINGIIKRKMRSRI